MPFLHIQPRLNVGEGGRGTDASGLSRVIDPVDGLSMHYNGWEPGQIAPPSGSHDHFNSEVARINGLGNLLIGRGYRDQAEIDADSVVAPNPEVTWDPARAGTRYDAARIYVVQKGLTLGYNLRPRFATWPILSGELWAQWEWMFHPDMENVYGKQDPATNPSPMQTHKAFQLAWQDGGPDGRIMFEPRFQYPTLGDLTNNPSGTLVATMDIRSYLDPDVNPNPNRRTNPVSALDQVQSKWNNQPSPSSSPYVAAFAGGAWPWANYVEADHLSGTEGISPFSFFSDRWAQMTFRLVISSTNEPGDTFHATSWLADELTDPVQIHNAIYPGGDLNQGIDCGTKDPVSQSTMMPGFSNWWLEMLTSQEPTVVPTIHCYIRNLIVSTSEIQRTRPISPA